MPSTRISREALEPALSPLVAGALAIADGALARVWLMGPGDICGTCPQRAQCPDQSRCLHLVGSAGLSRRLDGPFRRIPLGAGEVGQVPLTGRPWSADGDLAERGLAEATWLAGHGIRSFVALPLVVAEEVIGVLAVFSRRALETRTLQALTHTAELGALALGHLRAYRELATDRNRLVARAARERGAGAGAPPASAATALRPLADSERETIASVLAHTGGRVSGARGAARILGLKSTTLFSRMKKLGIDRRAAGAGPGASG